jgi:hypothetical protein
MSVVSALVVMERQGRYASVALCRGGCVAYSQGLYGLDVAFGRFIEAGSGDVAAAKGSNTL